MNDQNLQPYALDTELTGYMPLPRELLDMGLPARAVLLYAALLDRGTLSRKNSYSDGTGQVFVIYTLEHLAQTLHISDTAVKRHLRELEEKGLIRRRREVRNGPSQIYLRLPTGSIKGSKCPVQSPEMLPPTGRKVPMNNRTEQQKESNYYQHGEDESL